MLQPTDMVWKDGMARWIRASSVKELFPDPGSALDKYFPSSAVEAKQTSSVPTVQASSASAGPSKSKPLVDDEDELPRAVQAPTGVQDEDDRPAAARRTPRAPIRASSSSP